MRVELEFHQLEMRYEKLLVSVGRVGPGHLSTHLMFSGILTPIEGL